MAGGGAPQLGGVRRLVERQRVNINAQKLLTLPLREEYVWREGYRRVCTRPLRGRFGMGESIRRKRVVLFVLAVVVVLAGAGVASANTVYPPGQQRAAARAAGGRWSNERRRCPRAESTTGCSSPKTTRRGRYCPAGMSI